MKFERKKYLKVILEIFLVTINFVIIGNLVRIIRKGILEPAQTYKISANPDIIYRWLAIDDKNQDKEITISGKVFLDLNANGGFADRPDNVINFEKGIGRVRINVWRIVWDNQIDFSKDPAYYAITDQEGNYSVKVTSNKDSALDRVEESDIYLMQIEVPENYIDSTGGIISLHTVKVNRKVNFGLYPR
ncbi:MAG: hypothetical protein Athens101410_154 [Parcubacteria group bacterium Athens1014_10]|nr:MAG: hypothetical protein Athens101410_154 [Parcubacteria group bacterium Athens1014_10]TSD05877.1 MAG: hypothetical protein Athens071412_159 [Parcubacteria group bacterium Athens0714_12]